MSHRIGIVGFTNPVFDTFKATELLFEALVSRLKEHPDCTVVSGYTDTGISNIAYRVAQKLGMRTMGIACERAEEHPCFPCDFVMIEGREWGDESALFLASIDEMIKLGDGKQSAAEFASFKGPKVAYTV